MLSASRVVAGVVFAIVTWFACEFVVFTLPDDKNPGLFSVISAALAFVVAWRIAGPHQREGYKAAFSTGLTTAVAITICVTFLHAGIEMIDQSMRKAYGGPMEAIVDMFSIAGKYAMIAATPFPIAIMVFGGIFGGFAVEWASRRWN
ncbi:MULTISPECIES: TrgA family protein [Falsihalocynthiibacter]|uniref:TrgA family protein n=1 Tax=Falsihalocynthiibacter TaxID=2854182 RepID=UPI0030026371